MPQLHREHGARRREEDEMIKGLHHSVYRCRNSQETRSFYEDFLGLRFVSAFEIADPRGLHTFFEMEDGSFLAFFEVPGLPFEFKNQNELDLHIALRVEPEWSAATRKLSAARSASGAQSQFARLAPGGRWI